MLKHKYVITYNMKGEKNQMEQKPKTILMLNQKGGVGKSLLIDQLCYMADKTNMPYSLRDFDQQGGLNHKPVENPNAAVIFIDTPGQITQDMVRLIPEADLVLVPTNLSKKDIAPLQNTIQILTPYMKIGKDVLFILNRWNRFTAAADFEEWFYNTYPDYPTVEISESDALRQADEMGESILDYRRNSKSSLEMMVLWKVIMEEHLGAEFVDKETNDGRKKD